MELGQAFFSPFRNKKAALVSIQWVVVIGISYLSLFHKEGVVQDPWALSLVFLLLTTVLVLQYLPAPAFEHKLFPHLLVVIDTVLVALGIGINRESPWDLFLIFFFGLFIAGIGQGLVQAVIGFLMLGVFSAVLRPGPGMSVFELDSELLLRIPFLFGAFILYGYLAEQVKREKRISDQRQAALHEVNAAMTSTLDLQTILELLLEKMDLLLPYSAATIRLFNPAGGQLEPVAARHLNEEGWKVDEEAAGRGLADRVFEQRSALVIPKASQDPRVEDREFFERYEIASYLGVPLEAKGEILGALSFYYKGNRQFARDELDFITTLAGLAAIAIHNSKLYEQTKNQATELERANKVKDEFLSVMSHELRTPLNVVIGYTVMMRDGMLGEISPEQKESLDKVVSRSQDLLGMISSILEVTRMEADKVAAERRSINLGGFLSDVQSGYGLPLSKGVSLVWDLPSDFSMITTDANKLKHVLQNLINNAIKFTERGRITISARCHPETKTVEFQVADTGVGIPKEAMPFIFDKFRQVDSSETRSYGGVGMGLYIVKKFTEMLGGEVRVESEPGRGTTFTVSLPILS